MSRILLLRHGETEQGRASRYCGQTESPLTLTGVAQHAAVVQRLSGERISRIESSDLQRCRGLAEAIGASRAVPVETDTRLREASFGVWEGMTYDEAMARDRTAMVALNRDPARVAPPGGESLAAAGTRAHAAYVQLLREHKAAAGALAIVSHGGTLRALLCMLLQIPLERYWTLRIDAGSVTVLDTYPMGPIVEVLNETSFLPGAGG